MITDADLLVIEQRARAATRGPWRVVAELELLVDCPAAQERLASGQVPIRTETVSGRLCYVFSTDYVDDIISDTTGTHVYCPGHDYDEGGYIARPDADFIAAARADVPLLAKEVRRLRRLIEAQPGLTPPPPAD